MSAGKLLWAMLFLLLTVSADATAENYEGKVYGATFPSTYMLYIVAPDRLAGWNGPFYGYESKYIPEKYRNLPVLGGWYGEGYIPDKEVLLNEGFRKAFLIVTSNHKISEIAPVLEKLGIEVITAEGGRLEQYIPMMRSLGKELGVPERGEMLATYAEELMDKTIGMVRDLPEKDRLRVFVAQRDGLTSGCNIRVLDLVNAINVYKCSPGEPTHSKISFEQVMRYDPDVVLIADPKSAEKIMSDPRWQRLRAFKTGRFYVIPYGPFPWLDKPAVMQFIAMPWLACELYPDKCNIDIVRETKKFMNVYLHLDLTDAEVMAVLKPGEK